MTNKREIKDLNEARKRIENTLKKEKKVFPPSDVKPGNVDKNIEKTEI